MKVSISKGEWYPVFELAEPCRWREVYEIPDDKITKWKKVFSKFDAMQEEMQTYLSKPETE